MKDNMIGQKTTRSSYFDLLKGVAIILVVLGHSIQYGSGATFLQSNLFYEDVVFKTIYSFHMPLFAIVSGYLFFFTAERRSAAACLTKQIFRLCIPALAWTLCIEIAKLAARIVLLHQKPQIAWIVNMIQAGLTDHWFLWGVFWCSIVVILNRILFRDYPVTYLVVFLLLPLIPDVGNLHLYAYLYPFFVGAYLFHKYGLENIISGLKDKWKILTGALMLALWILMFYWYHTDCYIYTSRICIWGKNILCQLGIDYYRWAIGLFGSAAIMIAVYYLNKLKNVVNRMVVTIGKHTLGIYIISSYVNSYLQSTITKNFSRNYLLIAIQAVVILFATLGLTLLIKKIKFFSTIFLGGR